MTATKTNEVQTNEAQLVGLVRNALLVAGQEMGAEGDHWPVINSTIDSLVKDWEAVEIERNVQAELKINFLNTIRELKSIQKDSPNHFKPRIQKAIDQLQEIYDAAFAEVDESKRIIDPANIPAYITRAEAIIKTLEDEDA
jgi:hypothetical protein